MKKVKIILTGVILFFISPTAFAGRLVENAIPKQSTAGGAELIQGFPIEAIALLALGMVLLILRFSLFSVSKDVDLKKLKQQAKQSTK